ncbi:MAG: TRAP transporter fused permease subunit [Dehalococcoidales bacterium]|nr:TRAP transporter fused permease subunit [Dehalococcoidales bacterium]
MAAHMYSLSGMFGFMLTITMYYIVLFVLVGAFLSAFGAEVFFIELPRALFARVRGGAAMTAVGASTLFGMISGSPAANVAGVGVFTIPLMKRTGYPPEVAGAIEAASSTGGAFMPPVMGAAAFIMANLTGDTYTHIALISLVPALIYFFSVLCFCQTEARRTGVTAMSSEKRQPILPLIKKGWIYLLPIIVLIFLLVTGYIPYRAAWMAVMTCIVIGIISKLLTRDKNVTYGRTFKEVGKAFSTGLQGGASGSLTVCSLLGTLGIIVSVVFLTGLGFTFTSEMTAMTGGSIPVALLLAFVASYVLGMGMTLTAVYVLVALMMAPALVSMGIPLLSAHMVLFWFSAVSGISPPVAVAGYVAASIAGADPIRTCFNAFKYSAFLFIFPIMFVYSPVLMLNGFNVDVALSWVSAFFSAICLAGAISGYLLIKDKLWERLALATATLLLLFPGATTSFIGFALLVTVIGFQVMRNRRTGQAVNVGV